MIRKEDLLEILYQRGELKRDHGFSKIAPIKPNHGSCCSCQDCGQFYDDCVCTHNEWIDIITTLDTK